MSYKAHIFGFDTEMTSLVSETLFFAGAEPIRFEEFGSFTKTFKQDPPTMIVLPLRTIDQLDLHVMLGSDERFDQVAVLAAVDDAWDPLLKQSLETCVTDYFLTSQPYHLKRQALAVMSRNPWSESPTTSGRLLLAESDLERRIALARVMRIAQFDVTFADSTEDLEKRLADDEPKVIVLGNREIATDDAFRKATEDTGVKKVPWIVYGDGEIRSNTAEGRPGDLTHLATDPNPDSLLFHVQEILKKPLKDLRQCRRLPMFAPVRFQVETLRDVVWAYTRDISLNGLFIRTIVPPPPETMLTISFRPPTAEGSVQVGARVAWRKEFGSGADPMKPSGVGVQFTRVSVPDGASIEAGYGVLGDLLDKQSDA